jgi:carboxypeptidase family protein
MRPPYRLVLLVLLLGLPGARFARAAPPGSLLAVRVVDAAGKPMKGVPVRLEAGAGAPVAAGTTGADGRVRLTAPATAAGLRLRAEAADYLPAVAPLPAPAGALPVRARLVLRRRCAAAGRVVDPAGKPVQGARVSLAILSPEGEPTAEPLLQIATGAGGRFYAELVPEGRASVTVEAAGFAPAAKAVELRPEREINDLGTFGLLSATSLAGTVVDTDGDRVVGAEVFLRREGSDAQQPGATTDAEGAFALSGLRPGERFGLEVRRAGYAPTVVRGLSPPFRRPITIVLEPGRRIGGVVQTEDFEPIVGATLVLQDETAPPQAGEIVPPLATLQSGEEGTFSIDDLPPGPFRLTVYFANLRPVVVGGLEAGYAEQAPELKLTLRQGAALEGTVTTPAGSPAAWAHVSVLDPGGAAALAGLPLPHAKAGADGRFRMDGLEEKPLTLLAEGSGGLPAIVRLRAASGVNQVDVRLQSGVAVSGRVLTPTGEPLSGVDLRLLSLDEPELPPPSPVRSGAGGTFQFPAVAAGRYRLSGERAGYAGEPREVKVGDKPVTAVELRLARAPAAASGTNAAGKTPPAPPARPPAP